MKFVAILILLLTISSAIAKHQSMKKVQSFLKHRRASLRHRLQERHRLQARAPVVTEESSESSESFSESTTTVSGPPPPPPGRYPDTDDSSLENTALDTWIAKFNFGDTLIEPKMPEDLCVKPNGSGGGGGYFLKAYIAKHLELRKVRISDGYASYFLDQTDYFLLAPFEADTKAAFEAFWELSGEAAKGDAATKFETGKIDWKGLTAGIEASKWITKQDAEMILRQYAIEDEEYGEEKTFLTFREFTYANIFENIKAKPTAACTECYGDTKKVIAEFFKYADCNKDGMVSSENLYWGMTNMKDLIYPKTTTTMVNQFMLNVMEHHSAAVDITDFTYGLLTGMYERVISKTGISEIQLNSMKVTRREAIHNDRGPQRRK